MSEPLGARLRRERERRHIPLGAIAEATKIKGSLFEALERDDLSHWPPGIFGRSFIRAYAEAVGLDAEPIVREFLARFPDPTVPLPAIMWTPGPPASSPLHLRLTLAETRPPFGDGPSPQELLKRSAAVACDAGALLVLALAFFVASGWFWIPLAVGSLCYYVSGVLLLGTTPGVRLFAPRGGYLGRSVRHTTRLPRLRASRLRL